MFYSKRFKKILSLVPGKRFGVYRFLPIFFCMGAGLEYTMIHWHAFGGTNFYNTFKKRQAHEIAEKAIFMESRV